MRLESLVYMSAVVTPRGTYTVQRPGEVYSAADRSKIAQFPEPVRSTVHENLLTSQYVDKVYRNYLASEEGRAFVDYLRKHGNGKSGAGSIEDLIVINAGDGLVAATMPDAPRANLIINADFYDEFCREQAARHGLNYEEVLEAVIAHELHHYYGQTKGDLRNPEPKVEFLNDFALIKFYTGLASAIKDDDAREKYLRKAELFASRYSGSARETIDDYVTNASRQYPKAA